MHINIRMFSVLFCFLSFQAVWGQNESSWKNFTDMKKTNDAYATQNGIWGGTEGGAFYFNYADSSFQQFGKPEGLNGSPVTAVSVDKYGKIWFGSNNGIIDVYNPVNNSFKRILDIYNSGRTMKGINSITTKGDTVFISTDFGLSLINPVNYLFYDTFFKFGNLSSNIKVQNCLPSDLLYVCLDQGLAIQKSANLAPSSPDSWRIYTTQDGLTSNNVKKIIKYRDTILAIADKGIQYLLNDKWIIYLADFRDISISDISQRNDTLFILASNELFTWKDIAYANVKTNKYAVTNKIVLGNANQIFTTTVKGIKGYTGQFRDRFFAPQGPEANYSSDMTFDSKGNLWVASASDRTGIGFYKYDGKKWDYYSLASFPVIQTDSYFKAYSGTDNKVYLGSWGAGFLRITNDTIFQVFNTNNTPLVGTKLDPKYLVIHGMKNDSKNNIWILNYESATGLPLNVLTKDSLWYNFGNYAYPGAYNYTNLVVDQYDTKWFVSDAPSSSLYYFNENSTLSKTTDDVFGSITSSDGLKSYDIKCLALDKRGDLWVGTSLGANIITNTGAVLSNKLPKILSAYAINQQGINCIAVDPLNQKWVGTNQGLMLLSTDGTSLIKVYDSKNSFLLSDVIKSVAIDENSGTVYVGTDYGISSFQTSFIKPADSFSELKAYPNPLIIDGTNKVITIDGLIKDTDMKILSVSGKLIQQVTTPGGRVAFWDGKDSDGKFVGSGIYIIVAYDKEGNSVAKTKVAVIRNK